MFGGVDVWIDCSLIDPFPVLDEFFAQLPERWAQGVSFSRPFRCVLCGLMVKTYRRRESNGAILCLACYEDTQRRGLT